jgi:hypothetical protein
MPSSRWRRCGSSVSCSRLKERRGGCTGATTNRIPRCWGTSRTARPRLTSTMSCKNTSGSRASRSRATSALARKRLAPAT